MSNLMDCRTFDGTVCEYFKEFRRFNQKTGEPYWDRKSLGRTTYTYQAGDTFTRRRNVVRNVTENNEEIHYIYCPVKEIAIEASKVVDIVDETPAIIDAADSICSIINAIVGIKNARILKAYIKNNRIHIDWIKDNKKEITSSNPLIFKK